MILSASEYYGLALDWEAVFKYNGVRYSESEGRDLGGQVEMEIEVKLFATLRDYLPAGSGRFSCKMEFPGSPRVKDILSTLKIPDEIPKIILVNGIHGKNDQVLKEGDVVSVFPPVAGG